MAGAAGDGGAAARSAASYDLQYWEQRYERDGSVCEWYTGGQSSGSGVGECGAAAQSPAQLFAEAVRAALGGADAPSTLLDLGCGTSRRAPNTGVLTWHVTQLSVPRHRLADELAAEGHAVTAVDNSAAAVAACLRRQAAEAPPAQRRATYAQADATALPFADGTFHCVLDKATFDSLECCGVADDAAAECWRVLRPSGALVSATCRDASERLHLLRRLFAPAAPPQEVWAERGAPCATFTLVVLRRRDTPLVDADCGAAAAAPAEC